MIDREIIFIFSNHAKEQMIRRVINYDIALSVVYHPDQIITDDKNPVMVIYQSLIKENEQLFLYRVFVNRDKQPNVIVTLYKTTKISKYYESKV